MKPLLSFLFLTIMYFLTLRTHAQEWEDLGRVGYCSRGAVENISLAVSRDNVPYVLYSDFIQNRIFIKKHENGEWITVGNLGDGVKFSQSYYIAVDKIGTPFVLHGYYDRNLYINKYTDTGWQQVGDRIAYSSYTDVIPGGIRITESDSPIVAYITRPGAGAGHYEGPVILSSLRNGKWRSLARTEDKYRLTAPSMIANRSGSQFVSYSRMVGSKPMIFVEKYSARADELNSLGDTGFEGEAKGRYPMAVDSDGDVYYACRVGAYACMMHYSEGKWDTLDVFDTILSDQQYYSTAVDGHDAVCVAYASSLDSGRLVVKRYKNGNSSTPGSVPISTGKAYCPVIATKGDGPLYVVYQDEADSNYIHVKRFGPAQISAPKNLCIREKLQLIQSSTGGSWYVDDTTVATVNVAGVVSGVASGQATVYYTLGEYTVHHKLTVNECYGPIEDRDVLVFPNPGTDHVYVVALAPEREDVTFIVTDASGNKKSQISSRTNTRTKVNFDGLPSGVYLIHTSVGGWKNTVKVSIL